MIARLRAQQLTARLAVLAAVLLFAWQTANAAHLHTEDHKADQDCLVCANSHHDDDSLAASDSADIAIPDGDADVAAASANPVLRKHRNYPSRAPPAS